MALSISLANIFDATLCYRRYSRLLYDCSGAIRDESETYDIPGNRDLSAKERDRRVEAFYHPFQKGLSGLLDARKRSGSRTVLVTAHSFTPVYFGKQRLVEVGILHGADTRLDDAMLAEAERLKSRL